jgi:hypothetical protein
MSRHRNIPRIGCTGFVRGYPESSCFVLYFLANLQKQCRLKITISLYFIGIVVIPTGFEPVTCPLGRAALGP